MQKNHLETINKKTFYYQNVRGLRTKLKEFSQSILISNFDFLLLTETWLSSDFKDSELGLELYSVYRKDRDCYTSFKKIGGGVLIAVKDYINSSLITLVNKEIEQIQVFLRLKSETFILSNVYFPPRTELTIYEKYCNDLEIVSDRFPSANLICCADFIYLANVGLNSRRDRGMGCLVHNL